MAKALNVFKGPNAVRDYLDPGKQPYLPMVEIPDTLNPFAGDRVRIFAKLMSVSPLANVKAVPAYNMMREHYRRGDLDGVTRVVESSSGNTVLSLALAARQFGVEKTLSFVPHEISWHKLLMLLFFGVEPIANQEPPHPDAGDPRSGVFKARKRGKRKGWINPGQYDNPDNPKAHQKWTGKQIWEQTGGRINVFCAGLGTTGTVVGNARYLKRKKSAVQIVGAMREDGNYVPGVRTRGLLRLIGFDWECHVDDVQKVTTAAAYRNSLQLSRRGIVVGPSAGFALAGLHQYLRGQKESGALDSLRGRNGEIQCVFICPDSPIPYLDEYAKYLQASDFPAIQNEELLVNRPQRVDG
jgi:cysteine synthase A